MENMSAVNEVRGMIGRGTAKPEEVLSWLIFFGLSPEEAARLAPTV